MTFAINSNFFNLVKSVRLAKRAGLHHPAPVIDGPQSVSSRKATFFAVGKMNLINFCELFFARLLQRGSLERGVCRSHSESDSIDR
jgi:hypothetical protein